MEKHYILLKMYITRKVNFHSLIYIQFKLSSPSADCLLVEVWGLPSLSTMVGGEIEKLVGHNRPSSFVKTSASLLDSQGSG